MKLLSKIHERTKYIDFPWLYNRLNNYIENFQTKDYLKSLPAFIIIEPCNHCNLRCPLCPTGQQLSVDRGVMRKETFALIIDQLHRFVRHINLFYLGEPLLCKNLPWMIQYARNHKIKVSVSTNLNVFNEKICDDLINTGLDYLIVSLDGVSQNTYATYRIGGNYDRVLNNIRLLANRKRELGSAYPRIFIQFVVFKHNESEVSKIKEVASSLGVEIFFRQGALGGKGYSPPVTKDREEAKKWLTQDKKYQLEYDYFSEKPYLRNGKCNYLWSVATINWDGSVFPCCWIYEQKHSFGNILHQEFKEIWNNDRFRTSRRLFSKRKGNNSNNTDMIETICFKCKMYKHERNKA